MIVVDKIAADEYKTKTVVACSWPLSAQARRTLIVNDTLDAKFVKSAANIPGVKTAGYTASTPTMLSTPTSSSCSVDAAKKLEEVYA